MSLPCTYTETPDHRTHHLPPSSDIGNALSGEQTASGLERTWRVVTSKGSQLLALTIPECHAKVPWLNEARNHVNEKILNHKARNL